MKLRGWPIVLLFLAAGCMENPNATKKSSKEESKTVETFVEREGSKNRLKEIDKLTGAEGYKPEPKEVDKLVDELIPILNDEHEDRQRLASDILGKRLQYYPTDKLIEVLKGKNQEARFYAILALGDIGRQANKSVEELIRALDDRVVGDDLEKQTLSLNIRWAAAYALGKIGGPAKPALDALKKAAKDDSDSTVREFSAAAVKSIEKG